MEASVQLFVQIDLGEGNGQPVAHEMIAAIIGPEVRVTYEKIELGRFTEMALVYERINILLQDPNVIGVQATFEKVPDGS